MPQNINGDLVEFIFKTIGQTLNPDFKKHCEFVLNWIFHCSSTTEGPLLNLVKFERNEDKGIKCTIYHNLKYYNNKAAIIQRLYNIIDKIEKEYFTLIQKILKESLSFNYIQVQNYNSPRLLPHHILSQSSFQKRSKILFSEFSGIYSIKLKILN